MKRTDHGKRLYLHIYKNNPPDSPLPKKKSEYFYASNEGLADRDSPPLESVTRRACLHSVSACILHFVPVNMEICPSEILWLFFFFFFASPFMHAMKSAADCPYVTVYRMQVSRWEPVDYTLGTCCSLACLQCVFLFFFFGLIMLLLLRRDVGGIIQTLRNSYTN